MRLANNRNEDFDVKDASHDAGNDPHICIKNVELQRALHRDIDAQSVSDNSNSSLGKDRRSSESKDEKDRWSSKSRGENTLSKPSRRDSSGKLS